MNFCFWLLAMPPASQQPLPWHLFNNENVESANGLWLARPWRTSQNTDHRVLQLLVDSVVGGAETLYDRNAFLINQMVKVSMSNINTVFLYRGFLSTESQKSTPTILTVAHSTMYNK